MEKIDSISAEQRFRRAFERLKKGDPTVVPRGTPLSQNNVAREAGCDPSALRKSRFPALIREIQAYLELHDDTSESQGRRAAVKTKARRSIAERLVDATKQRDVAQSLLVSAERRIIELYQKIESLERRLDETKRM